MGNKEHVSANGGEIAFYLNGRSAKYSILEGPQSMPGFNSKMAKISGKRTPCCGTTCQEESNDISYVSIGAVSWEEFGYKVKKDSFL